MRNSDYPIRATVQRWCGVAMISPKIGANVGSMLRTAHAFGVDAFFIVGARYKRHAMDTSNATKHVDTFYPDSINGLAAIIPDNVRIVVVEVCGSECMSKFTHPDRALYVLGPEDGTISPDDFENSIGVRIDTRYCLNVATAGAIALYSRSAQ